MIGETLVHYRVLDELGTGGMGTVYRARDDRLGRDVALKVLRAGEPAGARDRILREARAVSRLNHPGICTLHDVGSAAGVDFLVMELIRGRTLRDLVAEGPASEADVADWARQLAGALRAAHDAGIVHGDLKPGNVMLTRDGRIKILDFGLARPARDTDDAEATVLRTFASPAGTVPYMAPEQLRGEAPDRRSDVFALGAVLYALLVGRPPFEEDTPALVIDAILNRTPVPVRERRANVSGRLAGIIERCLAKDPEARFASAADLDDALADPAAPPAGRDVTVPSVAVLLFENRSGTPDDDYFCDGVTEDLITEISKNGRLRVFPPSTVAPFKGSGHDAAETGRRLAATHVVEGSLRRAGDRLRVTARLVRCDSGHMMWSERYDRTLEDVFAIQDDIARSVADALQVALSASPSPPPGKETTPVFSAYDHYLRGRQEQNRTGVVSSLDAILHGIEMYEAAIAQAPDYAQPWAGIAEYRAMQYAWYDRRDEVIARADAASRRAMELDPDSPDVLTARALVLWYRGDAAGGREMFDRVLERRPDHFDALYLQGRLEFGEGRFDAAIRLWRKGMEARPDDVQCPKLIALALEALDRGDEAREVAGEGLRRVETRFAYESLNPIIVDARAQLLACLGRTDEALSWLERAVELGAHLPALLYNAACLHGRLGRTERAVEILVPVLEGGFGNRDWIRRDPDLARVREHPEVARWLEDGPAP